MALRAIDSQSETRQGRHSFLEKEAVPKFLQNHGLILIVSVNKARVQPSLK